MKTLMILLLILTGCASTQIPFQKNTNGVGYSIESKGSANFLVKTQLPSELDQKSIVMYVARSVGEECLARGFQYFDFTTPVNGSAEGFCFKENKRKAFAVTFTRQGLDSRPVEFVIEDLNHKTNSKLQVGDKVVKIDGRVISSVSDVKSLAFDFGQKNVNAVKMELIRKGKSLTIIEPLADMTGGAYGPEYLLILRK